MTFNFQYFVIARFARLTVAFGRIVSQGFLNTRRCPFSQTNTRHPLSLSTYCTKLLTSAVVMSNSHTTTANSSINFQLILNNALKAYEKRTKMDLLAHPLAAELQDCNSPSAILAVLYRQVQGVDQSPNSDDRWTKWLNPTVNVLHTLSHSLGEAVSLVGFKSQSLSGICSLTST